MGVGFSHKPVYSTCKTRPSHPLLEIFQSSLDSGEIPDILRCPYITTIFKGGIKSLPVSYCPVILMSHLAKTFERIIRKSPVAFLEVNQKMNPAQQGFRSRRSCLVLLLEHYDKILEILETGDNVDCIYLDFAKCFDKFKLKKNKITCKVGI